MNQHIAFIGDSYCSDYTANNEQLLFDPHELEWRNQGTVTSTYCWPSLVAQRLGYRIANFGFGGMSWWHSWSMFLTHYYDNPNLDRRCLQAIVFCHTSPTRINAVNALERNRQGLSQYQQGGLEFYYNELYDPQFANWARQQYFFDIQRRFSDIKTVHLFCFETSPECVAGWYQLPGVRFINPLIWPSIGEITGTSEQIMARLGDSETRDNHLNEKNNVVLADQVAAAIENYSPGDRYLDMSQFAMINPAAVNWPMGEFQTK